MRNKPPKCVSDSASNEKSSACRPLLMLELTETHFRRPRHKPSKMDGFWRVAKMSDFTMQTSLLKRPRESMMHFSGSTSNIERVGDATLGGMRNAECGISGQRAE